MCNAEIDCKFDILVSRSRRNEGCLKVVTERTVISMLDCNTFGAVAAPVMTFMRLRPLDGGIMFLGCPSVHHESL